MTQSPVRPYVALFLCAAILGFFGWIHAQEPPPAATMPAGPMSAKPPTLPAKLDPATHPAIPLEEAIRHDALSFDPAAGQSYRPTVLLTPFDVVMQQDSADKPKVMQTQLALLNDRYDLSNRPAGDLMMSGGRKPVQEGVRVKLPQGVTWDQLAAMKPEEIRERGLFPAGFLPLPHVKPAVGGQVFPKVEIDAIRAAEGRSLERFDVDFDLPDHLTPEFPPPIFLSSRPDVGDFSRGQLLSLANYYQLSKGILTPVQIEGLRLLLTPFPQQEFNQTEDRKVAAPSLGVACLDCHSNFHTNAAFHLNPDVRPQAARLRLDTTSLRGMFNQQLHGSKRSLRSVEDFTEFEQQTAYHDGDHVSAARKGVNHPLRETGQVTMMAQMQNMIDLPPAPKLNVLGTLDPAKAIEQEMLGQRIFFGKGQCGVCHPAGMYMDQQMHDLKVERFYKPQVINGQYIHAEGPIKTFTLRGIKDSPPYMHDGRCMTLEDTVEFFNLILGTQLTAEEKLALTAFMRQL